MSCKIWVGRTLYLIDEEVEGYIDKLRNTKEELTTVCTKLLNVLESEPECKIYEAHRKLAQKAITKAKKYM